MRRAIIVLALILAGLGCRGWSQLTVSLQGSDGNLYGAGQDYGFYSYNATTGVITYLAYPTDFDLCLERSDGTFLGIENTTSPQAVKVTFDGTITTIAQFPSASEDYSIVCPSMANDGNYYGTSTSGGKDGYGYAYQLTAAGVLNIFYNFTGQADGAASYAPPVQASDGSLYWLSGNDSGGELLQRYSTASGLVAVNTGFEFFGPPLEASDGNFYAIGASNSSSSADLIQVEPTGASKDIYSSGPDNYVAALYTTGDSTQPLAVLVSTGYIVYDNDNCPLYGNYETMFPVLLNGNVGDAYFNVGSELNSGYPEVEGYDASLVLTGSGIFEGVENGYYEAGENCVIASESSGQSGFSQPIYVQPVVMTFNPPQVAPGTASTLNWTFLNAFSDTMQQCYGYGGLSGKLPSSGSASVTAPSSGSFQSAIVCGGTETGMATLAASNAALSLSSSTAKVAIGQPVTLTASFKDPGLVTPTGKVNFMVGPTVIGSAALSNDSAVLTGSTAGVAPGTYSVTAIFPGNANYGPGTSNAVSITVLPPAESSITLTPASQTVLQGSTVSLTAKVTGVNDAPTGKVSLYDGSTLLATATLAKSGTDVSSATFNEPTSSVPVGTYSVSASYGGDAANLPSGSSAVSVIVSANTPVALAISPNPVPAGDSFTLTATVKGKDTPSGTVSFYAGTEVIASANVGSGGVAQVTLSSGTTAAGTYQIAAQYSGDANNPAGTSPAVSLTVE